MDGLARRWLARAPVLLAIYFVWANRTRRRRRLWLWGALTLCIAWTPAMSVSVHADRAAAVSTLAWLHRHDLFWAMIFALVAGVLVSRRRRLDQMAATRSWTAALPVGRATAHWQAIVVEFAPASLLALALAAVFGSLSVIALVDPGIPAPIVTWAATTAGVLAGAVLSHVLPAAKPEDMYESSRYVPYRRRAETPVPRGSLAALRSWPVRHMFASARPKTIARGMIPVLFCVPLNSTAADAMLALGLLTSIGALLVAVTAAISVSAQAARWLKPLPLGSGLLARRVQVPALAFMFCAAAVESWLCWVLGSPVARCITAGVLTLIAATIVAVAGGLFAMHAGARGNHGGS